jgi:chromate transport protein ChrA
VAEAVFLGSSMTVGIKLEKFVVIAGFLVDTGILTALVIIVALLILVLLVEIYRRKRSKPQQKPELEPK